MEGLSSMGFNKPTPIQEQSIPIILAGKDIIACAQTGTGKTAAYVLPILHKIAKENKGTLNTLILAPTRELALQIDQQIEGFAYFIPVSSIAVYGGGDGMVWEQQKKALREGADVIIATPGRLIAQLQSGDVKLDQLEHLILDEADRMLDMGFYNDIIRIISYLPTNRQTILFSATMPAKMRAMASKILKDPESVNISISKPAEGILQQAYVVHDGQKLGLIQHLFKGTTYKSVIVFASTKDNVKKLDRELKQAGLQVEAFHSDLDQDEREAIMRRFRSRNLQIIIGTDILSRGIDVEGIDLVVNYDTPPDPEDYIHRIGRTARAETTGTAITFINDKDQFKFSQIEDLIGKDIEKVPVPEHLGEGPAYEPHKKRPTFNKRPASNGGQKKVWKKRT